MVEITLTEIELQSIVSALVCICNDYDVPIDTEVEERLQQIIKKLSDKLEDLKLGDRTIMEEENK